VVRSRPMARLSLSKRIAFSAMISLGVWLMAEATVTWLYAAELQAWESPPPSPQQGVPVMVGNPYLLYEYLPGQIYERGVDVTINSRGLRGPEPVVPKPPGVRRLLTTGDSSVFGFGVPYDGVFSSVAAASLGDNVEPIIGAIPGYSSFQSINLLLMRALETEPDLLVIANLWSDNNFDSFVDKDVMAVTSGFEDSLIARLRRVLTRSAVYRVADWKLRVRGSVDKVRSVGWQQTSADRGQIGERRVAIDDYALNLEKLVDIARDHDAEVVFVVLANNEDLRSATSEMSGPKAWDPYRQVMRDTAARHGAPVIDVPSLFLASKMSSEELFLDEMHPTIAGHRLMGEALASALSAKNWAQGEPLMEGGTGDDIPDYQDPFTEGTAAEFGPASDPGAGGGPSSGGSAPAGGEPGAPGGTGDPSGASGPASPADGPRIVGHLVSDAYSSGIIQLESVEMSDGNPQVLNSIRLSSGDVDFVLPTGEGAEVALRAYLDEDADGPDADDKLIDMTATPIDMSSGLVTVLVDLDEASVEVK
jgi:hypothetical protein